MELVEGFIIKGATAGNGRRFDVIKDTVRKAYIKHTSHRIEHRLRGIRDALWIVRYSDGREEMIRQKHGHSSHSTTAT